MKTRKIVFLFALTLMFGSDAFSQNWQLAWSDEFTNGISGDWVFETGGGGWGNNELQYYRRENATVQNGALVITAKRENYGGRNYTSARMKTQGKKSWKYGKIEARIAMPSFQGIWPAFWMLGDDISSVGWPKCGEIDIMEHVNTGNEIVGTIHWDNNGHVDYGGRTNADNSINNYHTYTIEWNSSEIKWFIDGRHYHTVNIAGGINGTSELHNNYFILLNLAVGGNWPGFSIDNGKFPTSMLVDYVRVYKDNGGNPDPNPPAGDAKATVYKHCDFGGYAAGLPVGNYAYGDLYARGIANEDISSLRVNSGYSIELFEHDNFTGQSITFSGNDACLVDNGWNDRTTSLKVKSGGQSFSRTIQAESYSAMAGVQLEGTTDAGGGQNVGYIDNGDWMAYNTITFPYSGAYKVEYRVASVSGGRLSLDLNAGSIQLGAVNVPATGGWQNWTTVSHTVNVNAGTYNLGVFAATGGWNINWIKITKVSGARVGMASEDALDNADYSVSTTLEISPNPVADRVNISAPFETIGSAVQILDGMGIEVLNTTLASNSIDVSTLSNGIYTIIISANGNKEVKRFVKQ